MKEWKYTRSFPNINLIADVASKKYSNVSSNLHELCDNQVEKEVDHVSN